mmetsp:Transcript_18319/g.46930  ORF Transcript_18319/g.46930 Transcript_18319/m.46930 type:complete len:244 (+) Transcript_18319:79-810(+)
MALLGCRCVTIGRLLVEGAGEQTDAQSDEPHGGGMLVPDDAVDDDGGNLAHDAHNGEGGGGHHGAQQEGGVRHGNADEARDRQRRDGGGRPCVHTLLAYHDVSLLEREDHEEDRQAAEEVGVEDAAPVGHVHGVTHVFDVDLVEGEDRKPGGHPHVRAHVKGAVVEHVHDCADEEANQGKPGARARELAPQKGVVHQADQQRRAGAEYDEGLNVGVLQSLHVGEDRAHKGDDHKDKGLDLLPL